MMSNGHSSFYLILSFRLKTIVWSVFIEMIWTESVYYYNLLQTVPYPQEY